MWNNSFLAFWEGILEHLATPSFGFHAYPIFQPMREVQTRSSREKFDYQELQPVKQGGRVARRGRGASQNTWRIASSSSSPTFIAFENPIFTRFENILDQVPQVFTFPNNFGAPSNFGS